MIIRSGSKGFIVAKSHSRKIDCPRCLNNAEHKIYAYLKGPTLGFIWLPDKYHLGFKDYYYRCEICGNNSRKISKEEVDLIK